MLSTFSGCQVQRPVLPGMSFKLKSYLVCAGVGAISRTPIQLWQCRCDLLASPDPVLMQWGFLDFVLPGVQS